MNLDKPMPKATHENPNLPSAPPLGSGLIEVSRDDLRILTTAILENWTEITNTGPWQSEEESCRFCGHPAKTTDPAQHDRNCPVLVAVSVAPNAAGQGRRDQGHTT
jgi:hypothetical protein